MLWKRASVLTCLLFGTWACDSSSSSDMDLTDASSEMAADPVRGKPLYDKFCGFCHGDDGQGYLADNANALSNQSFLAAATDTFLELAIIEGRPGTPMSPWGQKNGGPLSKADARDIVAYIREWQVVPAKDLTGGRGLGSIEAGRVTYGALCKDCHGPDGQGITALSLNNPWFLETASNGLIRDAIEVGREGTPMPAYGDTLTPIEIDNLVALIRSWAQPVDGTTMAPFEPDISKAILNPAGAVAEFDLRENRFVPAAQVKAAMDDKASFVIIDARPVADYLDSHIKGAVSIPFYRINEYYEFIKSRA